MNLHCLVGQKRNDCCLVNLWSFKNPICLMALICDLRSWAASFLSQNLMLRSTGSDYKDGHQLCSKYCFQVQGKWQRSANLTKIKCWCPLMKGLTLPCVCVQEYSCFLVLKDVFELQRGQRLLSGVLIYLFSP